MNNNDKHDNKAKGGWSKPARVIAKVVTRFFIPVCIVVAALGVVKYQMENKPRARRQTPARRARLVTVETVRQEDATATVEAMGTVKAARQTTLAPEVSGRVVRLNAEVVPGGLVDEGQELVHIDERDYEAVVERRRSELAQAEMNLRLEQGNQDVAREEYEMLDTDVDGRDKELVLRKPQLRNTSAAVEAAKANLDKALLDVKRCTVKSPFNAIIQAKHVDVGKVVSPSTTLVTVTGTDEYWIEALVPVDKLRWIDIPRDGKGGKGSVVRIYDAFSWGRDAYRRGRVLRLQGHLEEKGRMAKLLVVIKDPLMLISEDTDKPILLINSYVKMMIEGRRLKGVIPVDRAYVHNGDEIWVMNENNELEIRKLNILFSGKKKIFVNGGLQEGERIVTTNLSAAVEGMKLRVNGSAEKITDSMNGKKVAEGR